MKRKCIFSACSILLVSSCSLSPKTPSPAAIVATEQEPTLTLSLGTALSSEQKPTETPQLVITQTVTLQTADNPAVIELPSSNMLPIPYIFAFTDAQYLDEYGSEFQFLLSFFNAIRQQLLPMAYSFWNNDASLAGGFDAFEQEYVGLKPESITILKMGSSGAAGSIYTTIGFSIAGTTGELPKYWAGCYSIRTPNPALFDSKDYHSRHFVSGRLVEIPANASSREALDLACPGEDFGMLEVSILNSDPSDLVDEKHYVDSRSNPISLISSFWNALNRQEYARAYSYFEAPAIFPGPYLTFKAGYLDTRNVSGSITAPEKLAATGNWYWKVPVVMHAETKNGIQQAFVGCYIVHQSDPELYVSPPFKPMGIQKARFEAIDPAADSHSIESALGIVCDGLP